MKRYNNFINEVKSPSDPFNEEDWEYEDEEDVTIPNNIYVIYVIGQDMNFLAAKKKRITNKRRGWYEHYYVIATKRSNGTIHFNGSASEQNPYPAENVDKILTGKELVGHISGLMNQVRFDTLQNLCDCMGIPIDAVHIYRN